VQHGVCEAVPIEPEQRYERVREHCRADVGGDRRAPGAGGAELRDCESQEDRQRGDLRDRGAVGDQAAAEQLQEMAVCDAAGRGRECRVRRERVQL
jgi:hypothetical protein